MKSRILISILAVAIASASPALASPYHGPQHGQPTMPGQFMPKGPSSAPSFGQKPPAAPKVSAPHHAQAKGKQSKHHHEPKFKKGDRIKADARWVRDYKRFPKLDPRKSYWSHDDYIYQVDPNTGKVLALIGLINALTR